VPEAIHTKKNTREKGNRLNQASNGRTKLGGWRRGGYCRGALYFLIYYGFEHFKDRHMHQSILSKRLDSKLGKTESDGGPREEAQLGWSIRDALEAHR